MVIVFAHRELSHLLNDLFIPGATDETPEGKSLTAKVRDRMNRRFTGKRIDVTVNGWKALTSRGYGLIRGVRVWRVK
jgi:hypothetical protein